MSSDASNPSLAIPISGTGTTTVGQLSVSPGSFRSARRGWLECDGFGKFVSDWRQRYRHRRNHQQFRFQRGWIVAPCNHCSWPKRSLQHYLQPPDSRLASGTLTVTSNAQPSTATATLTGTGTAAPSHVVNLSWNASTSPSISGYNVYRAVYTTSCGSYAKVNSVLNTTTLYSDSSVMDGVSYCYAATAVNTSSQESGYSNIVSNLQIPLS